MDFLKRVGRSDTNVDIGGEEGESKFVNKICAKILTFFSVGRLPYASKNFYKFIR